MSSQIFGHGLDQGSLGLGPYTDRVGDSGRHQLGVGHTGRPNPPRATWVPIGDFGGQLQSEARLTAATGAGQSDQPMLREQVS